tara:strand:+ start:703 stop:927 length:225 start_codon:yes stop_codon:yes gene_type:complete
MLITKTIAKRGNVEYETVVYLTDDNVIRVYQYQFDGPDVLSTDCMELTLDQLAGITTETSKAYLTGFLNNYSVE